MRIDAHDDYLENGLTIEEVIDFCKLAKEAGVDTLDVSRGNILSAGLKYEVPSIDIPRAFNIDNAAKIRKETGMLTIGVGRINTPQLAEQILEDDKVDMVVIGRGQLVDPDFCNKAEAGKQKKSTTVLDVTRDAMMDLRAKILRASLVFVTRQSEERKNVNSFRQRNQRKF